MESKKIIITGASGFLGNALLHELNLTNHTLFPVYRFSKKIVAEKNARFIDEIGPNTNWSDIFVGIDSVVHCAARVHVMNDTVEDSLEAFREVNVWGTIRLAQAAAQAGVKRFIFISSIKVNGESTITRTAYTSSDKPVPKTPYGISKAEAEEQLRKLGTETGMEIVIIRPPLVYGPGVKANFAAISELVSKGLPLPFGMANSNKRSMVYVGNLVNLIGECITNPNAANKVFLVSDNNDLSLAEFIKLLSVAMGKKAVLLPVPKFIFLLLCKLTGKSSLVDRLFGSLQIDINDTCETLNWAPPYTVEDGFKETVKNFLK